MENLTLKPEAIFHFFGEICKVPRPSGHVEKMIEFLKKFGETHGLRTKVDETGNVAIFKQASKGMENRKGVILQSHMDMVCDKLQDVEHDFLKQPIDTYVDGEWLTARGTTLGADDGMGVAAELAVLDDNSLCHGPITCVFTVDEETHLTGAKEMKESFMEGDILINLDSEEEGQIYIGCAGGNETEAVFDNNKEAIPADYFTFKIELKKFTGGHSGDEINKKRANAIKVLTHLLYVLSAKYDLRLVEIAGGSKHNAIPREAYAVAAVPMADKENVRIDFNVLIADFENEYKVTDHAAVYELESVTPGAKKSTEKDTSDQLIKALHAVFNGVFAMSQEIEGFVHTSSNLAIITTDDQQIRVISSQRSDTEFSLNEVSATVRSAFELAGASVSTDDGYPGWEPNPQSEILDIAVASYKKLFHKDPEVKAIHAGLECGLFLKKYPMLDMVSFGPTLKGVHTPDEALEIATVDKFWLHLTDILVNIPEKK